MIKFLMRKTIYKQFDKESQDMLCQLTLKRNAVFVLCSFLAVYIYVLGVSSFYIIEILIGVEYSTLMYMLILIFAIFWLAFILVMLLVFTNFTTKYINLLSQRLFYLVYTVKGRALTKNDLKSIKKANKLLYEFISTQKCCGHCYSTCFEICKTLKKGSLEFIAIKRPTIYKIEKGDGKEYTMHVLYINNGWAFDTFSCLQFPIEKLYEIYKAKVYKRFNYDEISQISYDDFSDGQRPELEKWSYNNDCFTFLKT